MASSSLPLCIFPDRELTRYDLRIFRRFNNGVLEKLFEENVFADASDTMAFGGGFSAFLYLGTKMYPSFFGERVSMRETVITWLTAAAILYWLTEDLDDDPVIPGLSGRVAAETEGDADVSDLCRNIILTNVWNEYSLVQLTNKMSAQQILTEVKNIANWAGIWHLDPIKKREIVLRSVLDACAPRITRLFNQILNIEQQRFQNNISDLVDLVQAPNNSAVTSEDPDFLWVYADYLEGGVPIESLQQLSLYARLMTERKQNPGTEKYVSITFSNDTTLRVSKEYLMRESAYFRQKIEQGGSLYLDDVASGDFIYLIEFIESSDFIGLSGWGIALAHRLGLENPLRQLMNSYFETGLYNTFDLPQNVFAMFENETSQIEDLLTSRLFHFENETSRNERFSLVVEFCHHVGLPNIPLHITEKNPSLNLQKLT